MELIYCIVTTTGYWISGSNTINKVRYVCMCTVYGCIYVWMYGWMYALCMSCIYVLYMYRGHPEFNDEYKTAQSQYDKDRDRFIGFPCELF